MKRNVTISAILLAAGVATAGGLAYARSTSHENDAAIDLAKATVSLSQAIGSAESHAGGKAIRAELEGEKGKLAYQVEVVTADAKVMDVTVDATDGKVLSSVADAADRGEHGDRRGHDDDDND